MIVYFTGTGNSRYAADYIADGIGDEALDVFGYLKNNWNPELESARPWVFVCPTYAWKMPRIFRTLIEKGTFTGSAKAYFVMTCGNGVGDAERDLRALCVEKKLDYMGLIPLKMPENYIAMFPVPDEKTSTEIVTAAEHTLDRAVACLRGEKRFPGAAKGLGGKLLSGPINRMFYSKFIRDHDFYSTRACSGCGKCETLCPTNNITLVDGKPTWNGKCVHCMACICACPNEAVEYGKKSRGKRRYQCVTYHKKA